MPRPSDLPNIFLNLYTGMCTQRETRAHTWVHLNKYRDKDMSLDKHKSHRLLCTHVAPLPANWTVSSLKLGTSPKRVLYTQQMVGSLINK